MHSAICETSWVLWCSIDLWSILLYVRLMGCNGVAWIYGHLGGLSAIGICAFCYMYNLLGVMENHGSMFGGGASAMGISVTGTKIGLGQRQRGSKLLQCLGSSMDAGRYADKPWWFQCACTVVFPLEDQSRQP